MGAFCCDLLGGEVKHISDKLFLEGTMILNNTSGLWIPCSQYLCTVLSMFGVEISEYWCFHVFMCDVGVVFSFVGVW